MDKKDQSGLLRELKLLVKRPCKDSPDFVVSYLIHGSQGSKIWGRRLSGKRTKLSSLITLIHSDATAVFL